MPAGLAGTSGGVDTLNPSTSAGRLQGSWAGAAFDFQNTAPVITLSLNQPAQRFQVNLTYISTQTNFRCAASVITADPSAGAGDRLPGTAPASVTADPTPAALKSARQFIKRSAASLSAVRRPADAPFAIVYGCAHNPALIPSEMLVWNTMLRVCPGEPQHGFIQEITHGLYRPEAPALPQRRPMQTPSHAALPHGCVNASHKCRPAQGCG